MQNPTRSTERIPPRRCAKASARALAWALPRALSSAGRSMVQRSPTATPPTTATTPAMPTHPTMTRVTSAFPPTPVAAKLAIVSSALGPITRPRAPSWRDARNPSRGSRFRPCAPSERKADGPTRRLLFSWRLPGGAVSLRNEPARVPNGSSDGARSEGVCGADARLPRVLRRSRSPSSRHNAPTAPPCLAKSPDPTTFAPAWPYCDTRRRAFETRSIDS